MMELIHVCSTAHEIKFANDVAKNYCNIDKKVACICVATLPKKPSALS